MDLPVPPSANRMFRSFFDYKIRRVRYARSNSYRKWLKSAAKWCYLWTGNPLQIVSAHIVGPFDIQIIVSGLRANADVDNRLKPVLDLLEDEGIIANDKYARDINIRHGTKQEAPAGVRIYITPISI